MALAEASRRQELARPTPFTSAGRHAIGARELAHPVRTLLVVYLVSRVVSLLALWVAATWFQNPAGVGHTEPSLQDMFGLWDGVWYERVAREGYPVQLPVDADTGAVTYSAWAFYPLYPYLVKVVMVTGLPFTVAGLGTRDVALVVLMAPYMTPETAAALAVLVSTRNFLPPLVGLPVMRPYLTSVLDEARRWRLRAGDVHTRP